MITAKVIADSISGIGIRLTTVEMTYPRFIHSELMTHRVFSRNAASSRAIPIDTIIDMVEATPASPIEWGVNQSGMQAKEVHNDPATCSWAWDKAAKRAVESAKELQSLGLHKQVVNRVLEPFQVMKTVVTATEWDNFFWLRCHKDAQPEIHALADLVYAAVDESKPQEMVSGQWHTPYVSFDSGTYYLEESKQILTLEESLKVSASCCAQVSYRKTDDSLKKAIKVYDQLVSMTPVHASPFEHQGTPIDYEGMGYSVEEGGVWGSYEEGITHLGVEGHIWSGNFKGWVQYRQTIENNSCTEHKPLD